MPGVSGVTVVTNSCAFYFAHEAAGASGARHSLRPLFFEGQGSYTTRALARREIAEMYLDVIACDKREAFAQGSQRVAGMRLCAPADMQPSFRFLPPCVLWER